MPQQRAVGYNRHPLKEYPENDMPIYPYRCSACGFETEVMRKISDPLLTTCPKCSSEQFVKQLTAPGFQLKGTGWYATDFKGGKAKPTSDKEDTATKTEGDKSADATATPAATDAVTPSAPPATPAAPPAATGASTAP